MTRFLSAIVEWLRAGYPEGIPPTDTFAVLAFLTRRLTGDEVSLVANYLVEHGAFDKVDIGVAISKLTDEMPGEEDMERVRERLAANGWPLDDVRDDAHDDTDNAVHDDTHNDTHADTHDDEHNDEHDDGAPE